MFYIYYKMGFFSYSIDISDLFALLDELIVFLVIFGVNLAEYLSSLFLLHVFSSAFHSLKLLVKLNLLLLAVPTQLHLFIIQSRLLINQGSHHHYFMLFDI